MRNTWLMIGAALLLVSGSVSSQGPAASPAPASVKSTEPAPFVIGPEDILTIFFWREKELSGEVTVRPDGNITLPLMGEVRAAGSTPAALGEEIQKLAARFLMDPVVTVIVRQVNSRKVYITGEVQAPGTYPLAGPLTAIQLIALAGGVLEFAKTDEITIIRQEQNQTRVYRFNYDRIARGQSLEQNLELRPGDTVVVP